jgi:hypothetical protein
MAVVGGGNYSVFFTADETAGTWYTSAVMSFNKKIKTSVSRTAFTLDQNEDTPEMTTFLELYAPITQAASDAGEYEDGVKFNSATANSQTLGQIVYGGKLVSSGTGQTKRKVVVMLCKLAQDAGSFDMESGKYTKPKIAGEVVNNDAMVTVPAACFNTAFVSSAITITIPMDVGYKEVWLTCDK